MSEIIVQAPGGVFPTFGLEVISSGPVTLRNSLDPGPKTPPGIIKATGSAGDDILRSTEARSSTKYSYRIDGRGGNDQIATAGGNDVVRGGAGDDIISTARGDDEVFGDAGNDVMLLGFGNDTAEGGEGNDVIFGAGGIDTIYGDAGNDVIEGGSGADFLYGGTGNDVVLGGMDDDFIFGEAGDDMLEGGDGDDFIDGGAGNDTISGDEGNDTLVGGGNNDSIDGGEGNDMLVGGSGADILTGGGGSDMFRSGPGSMSGIDQITDFKPSQDKILLDRSLLPGSNLLAGALASGEFRAVDAIGGATNAKIVYEKSTGTIYYNPGSGTEVPLVQVGANLPITASDFQIVNG